MQLKNDLDGTNSLQELIENFYKRKGNRPVSFFVQPRDEGSNTGQLSYLLDRKHVIRYSIGPDDKGWGTYIGGLELAIGPHYFSPADFWSYKNFERFRMSTEPFDIEINLELLDEFLGYPTSTPY